MSIGVILSQFPRYDEVFLLRDLVELAKGDSELVIFSLRPCRDRVIHEQAKGLLPRTMYVPFFWSWELWRSHGHFLRRVPGRYLTALGWILRRHGRHPVILLKNLILFPKMVHFAWEAQSRGLSLLHAGWATYPATCAWVMNHLAGIPYSIGAHAHDIYTANPALVEKLKGAKFVVTCTQENRRHLLSLLNGAGGKVFVNYHGVDLARFAAASKPNGSVCRILAAGSLLPSKGFETLIEGCRLLKDRGIPFSCTIAGGGPLKRRLQAQIEQFGLSAIVTITGAIHQEELMELYRQHHLFVLPLNSQIHWGIPNVLIEAMAAKTPVISCDLPSLKELLEHGRSGWIIPEMDPAALAWAMERLWRDPMLRDRMAQVGYEQVVQRFSLDETGRRLREIFNEATVAKRAE